jgi:hypothetical protein
MWYSDTRSRIFGYSVEPAALSSFSFECTRGAEAFADEFGDAHVLIRRSRLEDATLKATLRRSRQEPA